MLTPQSESADNSLHIQTIPPATLNSHIELPFSLLRNSWQTDSELSFEEAILETGYNTTDLQNSFNRLREEVSHSLYNLESDDEYDTDDENDFHTHQRFSGPRDDEEEENQISLPLRNDIRESMQSLSLVNVSNIADPANARKELKSIQHSNEVLENGMGQIHSTTQEALTKIFFDRLEEANLMIRLALHAVGRDESHYQSIELENKDIEPETVVSVAENVPDSDKENQFIQTSEKTILTKTQNPVAHISEASKKYSAFIPSLAPSLTFSDERLDSILTNLEIV
ncbi:hypothetical protein BKA69DRAFT_410511 [Paraphysoderma sedebokerense]|nr:hypothetical protein BKA69DRAFT_410511 [Paraphysoderma sedebokerense]